LRDREKIALYFEILYKANVLQYVRTSTVRFIHCKKDSDYPVFLAGTDITAGYKKIANLFYSVELATYTRKWTNGAIVQELTVGGLIFKMLSKSKKYSASYDLK
jgi:hypothetical protein